MNIMFMQRVLHPEKGGIGRVTSTLARYFISQGHFIYYFTAEDSGYLLGNHSIITSGNFGNDATNRAEFLALIRERSIDVVINQNGLGGPGSDLAYHCQEASAKLISVVHSTLLGGVRNARYAKAGRLRQLGLQWLTPALDVPWINRALVLSYKWKIRAHFRRLCSGSTRVVLLSERIKAELKEIIGECPANVVAIPNSNANENAGHNILKKENRILWVGRVDEGKRLDLLLRIWQETAAEYPDWTLTVVGDGPCLPSAKRFVATKNVRGVTFVGSANAIPFYRDASILAFTSAYEGFPLVLIEAMAHGCVPISFNSFVAAEEIVDQYQNGVLIRPFDCEAYAQALEKLMSLPAVRDRMAREARRKAEQFSISRIGEQWIELLRNVQNE